MNERALLADMADRLFADHVVPPSHSEPTPWPASAWEQAEAVGLPGLFEDGGSWEDAHAVLRALGRHAGALPLAEAMLARHALHGAGLAAPDGIVLFARGEVEAARDRLAGTLSGVAWGMRATHLVVPLALPAGMAALVPLAGIRVTSTGPNLAGEPVANIDIDGIRAPIFTVPDLFAAGALLRASQMAGALEGVLALSIQYAGERKQFGRPIGAFQAVQHLLAVLAEETAAAGCAAAAACRAAARGPAAFDIAAAKLRANQAAGIATGIAHQVHGAIGFTREYRLHLLTRRLLLWRSQFGRDRHWADWIGRHVCRGDDLWRTLTERR